MNVNSRARMDGMDWPNWPGSLFQQMRHGGMTPREHSSNNSVQRAGRVCCVAKTSNIQHKAFMRHKVFLTGQVFGHLVAAWSFEVDISKRKGEHTNLAGRLDGFSILHHQRKFESLQI